MNRDPLMAWWRSQGDLNPRRRRERPLSRPARRWERMLAGLLGLEPGCLGQEIRRLPIERQPNNEVVYLSVRPPVVNGKCAGSALLFFAHNMPESCRILWRFVAWASSHVFFDRPQAYPTHRGGGFAAAKFRHYASVRIGHPADCPRAALTAAARPVRFTSFCLQAYAPGFCSDSHQRIAPVVGESRTR